jgi:hypothetical protein
MSLCTYAEYAEVLVSLFKTGLPRIGEGGGKREKDDKR